MDENIIVVDFNPHTIDNIDEWNQFLVGLNSQTSLSWKYYGTHINNKSFHSKERYINYFTLGWRIFINRKSIKNIISNQQFYGIVYAYFCSLFHVKKSVNNVIVSFIYNNKKGIIGKLYENFIKRAVNSCYVDKIIVHSEGEIDYYSNLLNINKKKVKYCPLGITDDSKNYNINTVDKPENAYVLGVGNSNRDFEFMQNALKNEKYQVSIFTDSLGEVDTNNVIIRKGITVNEYYNQLANCFCSVIPIDNPDISSGQLVLLQSFAFNKPVIITKSNVNDEYIGDGNAIVIDKDANELRRAINSLRNKYLYDRQIEKANKYFIENFTMYSMGEKLGEIIIELEEV